MRYLADDGGLGREKCIALVKEAVDTGITLFDATEACIPFKNDDLIGQAFGSARSNVNIAVTHTLSTNPESDPYARRPKSIRAAVEFLLKHLRMDVIDLFYVHQIAPDASVEDIAGEVGNLVSTGKLRYFGLSDANADTIRRAHTVYPVSVVQGEYSLWSREPESRLFPNTGNTWNRIRGTQSVGARSFRRRTARCHP